MVDPFAKAYVVANASVDAHTGEAIFGSEETARQKIPCSVNMSDWRLLLLWAGRGLTGQLL